MPIRDDDIFLGYCSNHCNNPRAMLSYKDFSRLYKLAGQDIGDPKKTGFRAMRASEAGHLIKEAWRRKAVLKICDDRLGNTIRQRPPGTPLTVTEEEWLLIHWRAEAFDICKDYEGSPLAIQPRPLDNS